MSNFFPLPLNRSLGKRLLYGLLLCSILVGADLAQRKGAIPMAQALWPAARAASATGALVLQARGQIPMPDKTPAAHASSLLALPATHPSVVMAFWFAGTRESAADVQIAASHFDRMTQQWSAARFVAHRMAMAQDLGFGVRRLGNPVAWLDAGGRIHLFVVATGLGGWAASRIVHLRQHNPNQNFESLSFDVVRVLPLSWLWNTSFLVRTAPLMLKDGGMLLPVHFELSTKYPVALRFDAGGEFKGMTRISRRTPLLQPALLALDDYHWLALMRDQRPVHKIAVAQTTDGGQTWSDAADLALDNPNASVAALALAPGRLLLAHNALPQSRAVLDLSGSSDGRHWSQMQALAHGTEPDEYSYPALAWADDSLWLSYTDQRRSIAWQRFAFDSR